MSASGFSAGLSGAFRATSAISSGRLIRTWYFHSSLILLLPRDHATPKSALLSSSGDPDGSGCRLLHSGDREAEHALAQASLNPLRVKVARERELILKVAHLVLLIDRTVPSRSMLLHRSPDAQDPALQRDRE